MPLLTSLLSGSPKVKENSQENPRPDYAPSYGYRTQSGEQVSVDGSMGIATAYRAKNIISDDVAKMPFQMMLQSVPLTCGSTRSKKLRALDIKPDKKFPTVNVQRSKPAITANAVR